MNSKKIFDDDKSRELFEQIENVNNYLSEELDKHINKEILLRVLEKNLLPVLIYPERKNQHIIPINYNKRLHEINIHMPKPDVRLFSEKEYAEFFGLNETKSFYEQITVMIERIKENE